jgi:hypothetical protein
MHEAGHGGGKEGRKEGSSSFLKKRTKKLFSFEVRWWREIVLILVGRDP